MSQELMAVHYDGLAQAAAWLLAVYAIYLQGMVVRRVRASDRDTGLGWLAIGAVCVGTGVWAQSVLSLVSLQLPIKVGYVPAIVMGTWLPSVVISAMAIWLYAQAKPSLTLRLFGGLLIAASLCVLVSADVSAMALQPGVGWSLPWLAGALLVSTLACTVGSLRIWHRLKKARPGVVHLGMALVLGSAYRFGQALMVGAVEVPEGAVCLSADQLSGDSLKLLLPAAVMLLFLFFHLGAIRDARAQGLRDELEQSLAEVNTALEDAAQHDTLTGLLNRQGFERRLRELLTTPAVQVHAPSVFRLSLDGFRLVTETYGDALGDTVMRHLALRLRGLVRDGDVLARAEADEFLLICHGLVDEHQLAQLALRLGDAIGQPCLIDEQDIVVSCSIGIARYPESATADQLLSHASDAMQTARRAGGAVYCVYHEGMDRHGADQIELQRDLRHAIERHQLGLHFQPKLRADTGELAGVEALARWMHPTRGMVSPTEFIPVAERFGLIGELGMWVLEEACEHIRRWHEAGLDVAVAVNVSAYQLRQPDLEGRVRDALKRHRIPACMLILEITESVAMDDIEASLRVFDMLDDIGVRLSIDDFGTGYSSLSYLRRLPARQLKIDRSFIRDLETSRDAQAIVEAVVRLAHALGMKVVAEGVETQGQADILRWMACDEIQGFLYGRPMSELALLDWMIHRQDLAEQAQQAVSAMPTKPPVMHEPERQEDDALTAWSSLEAMGS